MSAIPGGVGTSATVIATGVTTRQTSVDDELLVTARGGSAARLALEAGDQSASASILAPASGATAYGLRLPAGGPAAGDGIAVASVAADVGSLVFEPAAGAALPTSNLYTGRRFFLTTLMEWFTYVATGDSPLPLGNALWIGQPFSIGFTTTQNTAVAAAYNLTTDNLLTDAGDRGKGFSFDCLLLSLDAVNGDATAVSGTLALYKNSSTLASQTWSSVVQKGSTPLAKLTAGEVLGASFILTSGTLIRMGATARLARMVQI